MRLPTFYGSGRIRAFRTRPTIRRRRFCTAPRSLGRMPKAGGGVCWSPWRKFCEWCIRSSMQCQQVHRPVWARFGGICAERRDIVQRSPLKKTFGQREKGGGMRQRRSIPSIRCESSLVCHRNANDRPRSAWSHLPPDRSVLHSLCQCQLNQRLRDSNSTDIHMPEIAYDRGANVRSARYVIAETRTRCQQCNSVTRVFAFALPVGYESLYVDDDTPDDEDGTWEAQGMAAVLSYVEYLHPAIANRIDVSENRRSGPESVLQNGGIPGNT
jgi:hypothetical protein